MYPHPLPCVRASLRQLLRGVVGKTLVGSVQIQRLKRTTAAQFAAQQRASEPEQEVVGA